MQGSPTSGAAAIVGRTEASQQPSHGRLVPLDALRGVAIALVVFHHVGFRFPSAARGWLGDFLVAIGWAGVDLFFAISGYLITTILMRSAGKGALRDFYIKRFFRIVPLYLLALLLFVAAALLTGNDREVLGRLWINAVFLTAWFIPFLGENGVPYTITWSVSVEEFAYLLFGAITLLGAHRFRLSLYWIAVAALLVRVVSIVCFALEPITLYYFAPGRIDAIAAGGLAAIAAPWLVRRLSVSPWLPGLLWAATVGVLSLRHREDPLVATFGYTLIAFASAWLVLSIANQPRRKSFIVTEWVARLGLVSYFVYLFHGFVIVGLFRFLPVQWTAYLNAWVLAMATLVLTYLPAWISWKLFEYPLISLGRRIASGSHAS